MAYLRNAYCSGEIAATLCTILFEIKFRRAFGGGEWTRGGCGRSARRPEKREVEVVGVAHVVHHPRVARVARPHGRRSPQVDADVVEPRSLRRNIRYKAVALRSVYNIRYKAVALRSVYNIRYKAVALRSVYNIRYKTVALRAVYNIRYKAVARRSVYNCGS